MNEARYKTSYMISFCKLSRIGKSIKTENRLVVSGICGAEGEKWRETANRSEVSFGDYENVPKLDSE